MGSGGDEGGNENNQCPMPNAQCPMPHAQCPMPNAQSEIIRLQHLSGTSKGKITSYVLIWDACC
ncbi:MULTISPECIES: hypothetical protein [unclassified Nostoc]|uniref:hypothetical protein n=1 Tax=unclassified Nostoc TaxID=2593658 RepID=UPI00261313B5|nr:hypothetical protein [Nostoc sp. S13]MDF5735021.1 hypothetical protein [Nostoc sp. S13]